MNVFQGILCALLGATIMGYAIGRELPEPTTPTRHLIQSGYVIANGKYVPPPYRVSHQGNDLLICDEAIEAKVPRAGRRAGRFQSFNRGNIRGSWPKGNSKDSMGAMQAADTARHLGAGALVVLANGQPPKHFYGDTAFEVLSILATPQDPQQKVAALVKTNRSVQASAWKQVVEDFVATDELHGRINVWGAQRDLVRLRSENTLMANSQVGEIGLTHGGQEWVNYSATVLAMLLSVVALGTLMNHRPASFYAWNVVDRSPEGIALVRSCVVLLVLLGTFDLILTICFRNSIGFAEINPIGNKVLASGLGLTAIKMVSLGCGGSLLWYLRTYRGAQAAAWWMCLLTTVVTMRWSVFTSMFLSP